MINVLKLRARMVEKGYNMTRLAGCLGMDRSSLYRKLKASGETLTIREAGDIIDALHISGRDVTTIFFHRNVALNAKKRVKHK